jgi:hypothetical protein
MADNKKEIKEEVVQKEVVKEVVKQATPKKAKTVVKKVTAKVYNVAQFCNLHGVKALDAWVAKRFFPSNKDRKSLKEWEAIFDEKKIPFKR